MKESVLKGFGINHVQSLQTNQYARFCDLYSKYLLKNVKRYLNILLSILCNKHLYTS